MYDTPYALRCDDENFYELFLTLVGFFQGVKLLTHTVRGYFDLVFCRMLILALRIEISILQKNRLNYQIATQFLDCQ